jgi:cysteine-rich repeat protein
VYADVTMTDPTMGGVCGDGQLDAGEQCDDGNRDDFDTCTIVCTASPETPELQLSFSQVKQFDFSWAAVLGAEYYQLLESVDGVAPFVQVGGDIMGESVSVTMPLHFRLDASYKLRACNMDGCSESAVVDTVGSLAEAVGYFKASNTDSEDLFGYSVALSGDGNTLAVGAIGEDSNATGIGGNKDNNSAGNSGAVYVFVRNGVMWSQQAYVKAVNTDSEDWFGSSVALSDDGNTLAVGSVREDSNATGIGGNEADNSAGDSGAVYVFVRNGAMWSEQAYVKASNTDSEDWFGYSVALSGDGNTLAVGSVQEDSNATGIGGNEANNFALKSGAVYVFVRNGVMWSQQAYVKASNTDKVDGFGFIVALSDDGNTLAVGALAEDSDAKGIGGEKDNNSAENSGAVYVFVRNGVMWSEQAYVKASNTDSDDYFGSSVALSDDGNTLAVGAVLEDSNATGIGGKKDDNSAFWSGAVYVFVRNGVMWSEQAYVKASNTDSEDRFGSSVALSDDGNTLAVGSVREDSNATGIGGNEADNEAGDSGAVYVFVRNGVMWSQQDYVKASNTDNPDFFGSSVALSDDGNTLAVGATEEDSDAKGVGGDQADNSGLYFDGGAVYLY